MWGHRDLRLIFVANFLWTFGAMLYAFVWPNYVRDLGGGPREIGLLSSVMFATIALTLIPGGFLADRFERRRLMLITWGLATLAPLVYATATDWRGLIPGAVLYCIFIGWPAMEAYLADSVSPAELSRAFALTNAGYSAGAIISPLIGAGLLPLVGMRGLFWLAFFLFCSSTVTLSLIRPQRPRSVHGRPGRFSLDRGLLIWTGAFVAAAWTSSALRPFLAPFLEDAIGLARPWILATGSLLSVGEVALAPVLGGWGDREGPRALTGGLWSMGFGCLLLLLGGTWALVPAAILLGGDRVSASLFRSVIGRRATFGRGTAFAWTLVLASGTQALGPPMGAFLYELSPAGPLWLACGMSAALGALIWIVAAGTGGKGQFGR